MFSTGPPQLECPSRHPLDFVALVDHCIPADLLPRLARYSPRLAEIQASRELANDHQVDIPDDFRLESAARQKRGGRPDRPEIPEQTELLAQTQESQFRSQVLGIP